MSIIRFTPHQQIAHTQTVIRALSQEVGVRYRFWEEAKAAMEALGVSVLDIMHVLTYGDVRNINIVNMVGQCVVTGVDTDGRFLTVTVTPHETDFSIEVVGLT